MAYHIPMHGNRKPMPESTKKTLGAKKKRTAKEAAAPARKRPIHPVAQLTHNEINVGTASAFDKFVIFDLDGCVSNDAWRFGFVQDRASNDECFEHYHGSLHLDEPLDHGAELLRRCVASGLFPVFITARPEKFSELTKHWLKKHFDIVIGVHGALLMRANDDPTPTVEVKRQLMAMLTAEISPACIVAAYDDRADIVNMYHSVFGINAFVLDKDGLSDPLNLKDFKSRRIAECVTEYQSGTRVHPHLSSSMDAAVAGTSAALRAGTVGATEPADAGMGAGRLAAGVYAHPASESLAAAIDTLEDRAGRYGRADLVSAQVAATLFPNGLTFDGRESSMRMGMMMFHVIGKLSRFAGSGMRDRDSVHDMINYTAFMDEILRQRENESITGDDPNANPFRPLPTKF